MSRGFFVGAHDDKSFWTSFADLLVIDPISTSEPGNHSRGLLTTPHLVVYVLLAVSNPLQVAVVGNPPRSPSMAHRARARRSHSRHRKSRGRRTITRKARGHRKLGKRKVARLSRTWKKRTAPGAKFSWLGAKILKRPGKRKHVKGRAWTGRKGTVKLYSRKTGKLFATNPRRKSRGRSFFRNPGGAAMTFAKDTFVSPVMALPKSVPALFKKNVVKHAGFAAAGAVAGLVGGTFVQTQVLKATASMMPASIATALGTGIVQRVVGASFALLAGGLIARFGLKSPESKTAFITGTAAAALAEAVFPSQVGAFFSGLPYIGPWFAGLNASPVSGLAGLFGTDELAAYVQSPAYQGVGAYVQSPAYQGVGAYVQSPAYQGVGAYVQSPAYQGVGGLGALSGRRDAVAGMGVMGSNMPSHLDS